MAPNPDSDSWRNSEKKLSCRSRSKTWSGTTVSNCRNLAGFGILSRSPQRQLSACVDVLWVCSLDKEENEQLAHCGHSRALDKIGVKVGIAVDANEPSAFSGLLSLGSYFHACCLCDKTVSLVCCLQKSTCWRNVWQGREPVCRPTWGLWIYHGHPCLGNCTFMKTVLQLLLCILCLLSVLLHVLCSSCFLCFVLFWTQRKIPPPITFRAFYHQSSFWLLIPFKLEELIKNFIQPK